MKAAIAIAIAICSPSLPMAQRTSYATTIVKEATRYRVPALLMAAIVENESHWHHSTVSNVGDERYVGLGQLRLRNFRACREDLEAPACRALQASLLVGATNLHFVAKNLRDNLDYCRQRGHRGISAGLAGYQGNGCTPTGLTKRVIRRWHELEYRTGHWRRRASRRRAAWVDTYCTSRENSESNVNWITFPIPTSSWSSSDASSLASTSSASCSCAGLAGGSVPAFAQASAAVSTGSSSRCTPPCYAPGS